MIVVIIFSWRDVKLSLAVFQYSQAITSRDALVGGGAQAERVVFFG
jgi:hypothetical protein